jgi:hypothetical protein
MPTILKGIWHEHIAADEGGPVGGPVVVVGIPARLRVQPAA